MMLIGKEGGNGCPAYIDLISNRFWKADLIVPKTLTCALFFPLVWLQWWSNIEQNKNHRKRWNNVMNMQIIFLLSFLYRQRDISVRKYSHIDIKQNTKSLRSNNDCNIGRVCWMKCEMSRSRIFSHVVYWFLSMRIFFVS